MWRMRILLQGCTIQLHKYFKSCLHIMSVFLSRLSRSPRTVFTLRELFWQCDLSLSIGRSALTPALSSHGEIKLQETLQSKWEVRSYPVIAIKTGSQTVSVQITTDGEHGEIYWGTSAETWFSVCECNCVVKHGCWCRLGYWFTASYSNQC